MIQKALSPITDLIQGKKKRSTGRKRKFRYQVKLKGTRISRHYTKAEAQKSARSIRGARVMSYSGR